MSECSICQYDGAALEAERDIALHAASLVENPEYVATLQRAGVEYAEQLVARIEQLEKAWDRWADHCFKRHGCDWGYTERPIAPSTNEGSEG